MDLINTAMEKLGGLKDLLGNITDGDTAAGMKDQLATLVPSVVAAMKGMDGIPSAAKALMGDKLGDVTKMFDGIKGQASKLMENDDIKSKIGDVLGKLTG